MHKLTSEQRGRLGINELSPDVKQYIADLELAVDRLQVRSRAHREQLRSCNTKLELVNLREAFACLSGQARASVVNTQDPTPIDYKAVGKYITDRERLAHRCAV